MKEILNRWFSELLLLIFVIAVIVGITINLTSIHNHELKMAEQGYVETQGIGTQSKFWTKLQE